MAGRRGSRTFVNSAHYLRTARKDGLTAKRFADSPLVPVGKRAEGKPRASWVNLARGTISSSRTGRHRHRRVSGDRRGYQLAARSRRRDGCPRSPGGPGTNADAGIAFKRRGSRLHFYETNVGIFERCKEAVDAVLREHGKIDFLVNNAGITRDHTIRNMSVEEWEAVLQVIFRGLFL